MPFDSTYRYLAFDAALLNRVGALRDELGDLAETRAGNGQVKTLLCGPDNSDKGSIRAGVLRSTIVPVNLSDGRLCIGGYWSLAVIAKFKSGEIDGEELTADQVKSLTSTKEI